MVTLGVLTLPMRPRRFRDYSVSAGGRTRKAMCLLQRIALVPAGHRADAIAGDGDFDASVLPASLGVSIRTGRAAIPQTLGRDCIRVHTRADHDRSNLGRTLIGQLIPVRTVQMPK